MELNTERLLLRAWKETDAEECYKYAKDPQVGPIAGWPVHTSVENSRQIIRDILIAPESYAIVLKETGKVIGSICLRFGKATDLTDKEDECELGYWLGALYWGQGLMTEAAKTLVSHAFTDLGVKKVWCGYYDGNSRSKRVQEKCGFIHVRTTKDLDVPQMNEKRTGHLNCLTKEDWESRCK